MLILIIFLVIWLISILNKMIITNKVIEINNCVLMYLKTNLKLLKCAWYNFMWCYFFLLFSAFLGSHKQILYQETFFLLFYHYKQLYLSKTNTGHFCLYSGVVKYNFQLLKHVSFNFM